MSERRAPVLDRLITSTREVTRIVVIPAVPGGGTTTYRYRHSSSPTTSGSLTPTATGMQMVATDEDGTTVPDSTFAVGVAFMADWPRPDGGTYTVTGFQKLSRTFLIDLQEGNVFGDANIGLPILLTVVAGDTSARTEEVTEEVTETYWAERRDFPAADVLETREAGGLVGVTDARYIVRAEIAPWSTGDTFTDEDGASRTVRGVSEVGRGRYVELLARRVGA